jgi:hypothetical protein
MATMSTTTAFGGAKTELAPNFHIGGGFMLDDEEFGDFILSAMAFTAMDMTLEVFAHTHSQTTAPKEAPRGANPSHDL